MTTTADVLAGVDLNGTTAVVTGASTGLGWETARALAAAGATVIATARDEDKAARTSASLLGAAPGAAIVTGVLRLDVLDSVRAFATWVAARTDRLGLLVNNAGIMAVPEARTIDGFESQFGTNHLGHFLLTARLLPLLSAGAPSRVVCVSSAGHTASPIRFDDPQFAGGGYDPWVAYGQSKTANILFAAELDRRYGPAVRACSVHPGRVDTELARYMTREALRALLQRTAASSSGGLPARRTVGEGAATTVWACVTPQLDRLGGAYLADCAAAEPAPHAGDEHAAARLWEMSEALVGEHFP